MNKKTLWITETAVMIALLVALQWATKPLGAVRHRLLRESGVGGIGAGGWPVVRPDGGAGESLLRFSAGHRPGVSAHCPHGGRRQHGAGGDPAPSASRDKIATRSYLAVAVGAVTKFLALWLLIVKLVLPTLGLAEKQVAAISASFSWPQLVTAAIGGVLAVTIAPLIRKALRSK